MAGAASKPFNVTEIERAVLTPGPVIGQGVVCLRIGISDVIPPGNFTIRQSQG
jgi:hypothetical protein